MTEQIEPDGFLLLKFLVKSGNSPVLKPMTALRKTLSFIRGRHPLKDSSLVHFGSSHLGEVDYASWWSFSGLLAYWCGEGIRRGVSVSGHERAPLVCYRILILWSYNWSLCCVRIAWVREWAVSRAKSVGDLYAILCNTPITCKVIVKPANWTPAGRWARSRALRCAAFRYFQHKRIVIHSKHALAILCSHFFWLLYYELYPVLESWLLL